MMDLSKMTLKTLEGWQDHYMTRARMIQADLDANHVLLQRVMDAIHAKRQAMGKDESDDTLTEVR